MMKYFLLILVMLLSVSCCPLNKTHAIVLGYISRYTYGRPLSEEKFQEAMMLLYNKYPEVRITKEIYIEMEHNMFKYNKYFRGFPDFSEDFQLEFFGGKRGINVKTCNDNILFIGAQWPLFEENNFEFFLDYAGLKKYQYMGNHPGRLTCQELKEAQKEFETEILPKIRECIEIVKKKHAQNGNKNE